MWQMLYRFVIYMEIVDQDSSVGIATRYGLDGLTVWGSNPCEAGFSTPVQTGLGAHPTSYIMGTGSFQRAKPPGCGLNHSCPV